MIFDSSEKHQSQIPALQLLVAMGFTPLSSEEALRLRGGRLRNVTLDDVLADQLLKLNRFTHRGREYPFNLEDAHEAMRRLKPTPDRLKGLRGTNQDVYDTLVLGTTITKTIDGDSKSYSFRYVDWENPDNNTYHVTAELTVERAGSTKTRRCDIVAFVNGIPFIVIENKRPTERLKKADSQLIGYQREDNIPHMFPLRADPVVHEQAGSPVMRRWALRAGSGRPGGRRTLPLRHRMLPHWTNRSIPKRRHRT